jgi:hypothetical protein
MELLAGDNDMLAEVVIKFKTYYHVAHNHNRKKVDANLNLTSQKFIGIQDYIQNTID